MNGVHGKEDHHDRYWIDICRAVRRPLNRRFDGSAGHGDGDAGGKVIPERGSCEHTAGSVLIQLQVS
jgi:hypothetical protein